MSAAALGLLGGTLAITGIVALVAASLGLFTSLAQQVDASVGQGATLEATRANVHLDDWRTTFAGTSQLRAFLFDYYVTGPGVAAAYREATQKTSSN